ncbi:alpha/beta hydrolase [Allorhizocola rhizosphaerae]|uniref:alpha/beta hydrolase n=1 Tax=Allorhizocola rhizosphaerae TaxID=1872709 RepID=UPI000E3BB366|nr:alpha/beta hydrolase [Allorhizocola rhizosphaerae]
MEDRSVLSREAPEPAIEWEHDVYFNGPVVVLIHGGFWRPSYDRVHLRPMASALPWPAVSIEYRRIPGDPSSAVVDVRTAVERIRGPKVVVGHSAGGHLALWVAATLGLPAVALAPVADLRLGEELDLDGGAVRDFLGGPAADRPDLDPVRMAPAPAAVLIHGERDTIVPIGLSLAYTKAHPAARLVVVPDAGHFELIDPASNAWPVVIGELGRLLA